MNKVVNICDSVAYVHYLVTTRSPSLSDAIAEQPREHVVGLAVRAARK